MHDLRVHRYEPALDPALFRRLLRSVRQLGTQRLKQTYQTTFWYDFSGARCVPEQAAQSLRALLPKKDKIAGVEWWLSRMRTTHVAVDFHQDRDEKLALRTGQIIHPVWSSVLFLNRCRGGLLALTIEPPNPDNSGLAPDVLDFELIAPKPNRFVVFPGTTTHGVLDAENQIPTKPLKGSDKLRLTVIFNWWHRAPEGVPRWSQTRIYRSLGLS